ncbi:hypothetical protein Nepgr_031262 [Nepenthes gracilis]|uniref:BZIP domain-containing protein n=1 Tax=Nepenthes gracilis TaxID=150966 RepID=A0AAD3THZ2_NEPGR|nr:hypothetical protein Nepgr_031262 [Nepenthes gracilis]
MSDPILCDHHEANSGDFLQYDVDSLPIPPLDPDMLTDSLSLPENLIAELGFDFDLDFNFDDLQFAEDLLLDPDLNLGSPESPDSDNASNNSKNPRRISDTNSGSVSPQPKGPMGHDSNSLERGSNCDTSRTREETRVSNYSSLGFCQESGDKRPIIPGASYSRPSESGSCKQGSCHGSGFSQAVNLRSPESGNSDPDVSSSFHGEQWENCLVNRTLDRKSKLEDAGNKFIPKRKKEQDDVIIEARANKFRRSSTAVENANFSVCSQVEEKRKARLMRNRESAQLSRQRKKQYVEELEDKARSMHSIITELNSKISFIMAENAALRQQLSSAGGCQPLPSGVYPMAPMVYPWMPCPPYVVKPQGSQVPLVPIPRLKPQQPAPAPKVNKKESKRSENKTKKIASISFLGLVFFILLFGRLVPTVNVRYGGIWDTVNDPQKGKVLMVNSHLNGTDPQRNIGFEKFDHGNDYYEGVPSLRLSSDMEKEHVLQLKHGGKLFAAVGNASEPLVASLFVPRNDKLVKIDGNLIIHSVMVTEKAMASCSAGGKKTGEETSLALAKNYGFPNPIPGVGRNSERHSQLKGSASGWQRALGSGSADDFKTSTADGELQQWFREGLAGPLLSSAMCTEVFQFDISPVPAAIVPATGIANGTSTSVSHQNSTHLKKSRNRRILNGHPIPLEGLNSPKDGFLGNNSQSSIVVSVLVDPKEAGDSDGEGVIGSKTLSQIFVVVLIDSVKYITYSCILPRVGVALV